MLQLELLKKYRHKTVTKLNNTQKNFKKVFLNNKKIPIIPPLIYKNRFATWQTSIYGCILCRRYQKNYQNSQFKQRQFAYYKKCSDSMCTPSKTIFKQALLTSFSPSKWKKENVQIIHKHTQKKNDKLLKIIARFLYFQYTTKFFQTFIFNECLAFSLQVICYRLPTKIFHFLTIKLFLKKKKPYAAPFNGWGSTVWRLLS